MTKVAHIIVDSGFSADALRRSAENILFAVDLTGPGFLDGKQLRTESGIQSFAGDACRDHGSQVLLKLLAVSPSAQVVLVRAFDGHDRLIRTTWKNRRVARPGWSDACCQVIAWCRRHGYSSVTNCSFGGYTHAMDGTGWESFSLSRQCGNGHIVVAAAGAGDGSAVRATVNLSAGETKEIFAQQDGEATLNFWSLCDTPWSLNVERDGKTIFVCHSRQVPPNIWNGRQQQTICLSGRGRLTLRVVNHSHRSDQRFDCWIEGPARFSNYVNGLVVAEPACFPHVIAVGLRTGLYNPRQNAPGEKPDILLPGAGPISFRLPEVSAAIGRLLCEYPDLDSQGARRHLGKYPDLSGV